MNQAEYKMCRSFFSIIQLYKAKYPEIEQLFHVENEGQRSARTGFMAKKIGKKAGIPDYWLPVARCGYHGLVFEAKVKPNKPTESQKKRLDSLSRDGYKTAVCYSIQEMINLVLDYLGRKNESKMR